MFLIFKLDTLNSFFGTLFMSDFICHFIHLQSVICLSLYAYKTLLDVQICVFSSNLINLIKTHAECSVSAGGAAFLLLHAFLSDVNGDL